MAWRNFTRASLIIIFILHSSFVSSVGSQATSKTAGSDEAAHTKDILRWRAERLEEINGEDGWATLVGLFWLKPGSNKLGSDPSNDIPLPSTSAARFVGSIHLDNGVVRLEAKPTAGIISDGKPATNLELQSDDKGKPTILKLGSLKLFVIKRDEKLGLRLKDSRNPARANFA